MGDNIKMDLGGISCKYVVWIRLSYVEVQWLVFVDRVMDLQVS
jgi:hypothetical protein